MALLTVRAAADRLGIGYSTLKQWIHMDRVRTTQTPGGHHPHRGRGSRPVRGAADAG
jgi:excisionase family DNA binding protein